MKTVNLGAISRLEVEIYQREDAFFPDREARETVQKELLLEAFNFHYSHNPIFREYSQKKGATSEKVIENVRNIPLIPSTVFKKMSLRTDSDEKTVKKCFSSGTQGSVSVIERNNTTLERFLGSVRNMIDYVYQTEDAIVLNLGPSAEEAQDIWFSYVMSVSDLIFPTIDYVKKGLFELEKLVADLQKYVNDYQEILIIGAPIMFIELYKYLESIDLKFDFGQKPLIITAGGWKKYEGQAISKAEFKSQCRKYFPGLKDERIRDAFNMVELNSVIPECEFGSKHIPLWLDVFALDLDTYQVADNGKVGLLGFLDATPTSYPGFIMSGDLGRVIYVDNCPCGRNGVCIEIIRRINTIESRGCALKIEKSIS